MLEPNTCGGINCGEAVNLQDFASFALCFWQRWGNNLSGAGSYEALTCSLDRNGVIDLRDFAVFALNFGTG